MIDVTGLVPLRNKAIIRLERKPDVLETSSGLQYVVAHGDGYTEANDWEIGEVLALGSEVAEDGLAVGERVLVRAISGGVAGADISKEVGKRRNSVVVVLREEIVARIGE